MKKSLLLIGILLIIAAVICLALGALNLFGYYNVMDGSNDLYQTMHQRMTIFFTVGIILGVIGAVSLVIRSRM